MSGKDCLTNEDCGGDTLRPVHLDLVNHRGLTDPACRPQQGCQAGQAWPGEERSTMSKGVSTTVGLLIGGAVGAVTVLLTAPKSGKEVRGEVMEWTRDSEHKAAGSIRRAGSSIASGIRSLSGCLTEKVSMVTGMFTSGAEHAQDVAERVNGAAQRAGSRIDKHAEGKR